MSSVFNAQALKADRDSPLRLWLTVYMAADPTLSSVEIRQIGEALYGSSWQGEMARAIGVPRQSITHYLKNGGARGAQAAAIIGLIARTVAKELRKAEQHRATTAIRHADLSLLLERLDPA